MSTEWIIAILTIALTGMTAAFLVTYDKWDEQKQKTEKEHSLYLDAIAAGHEKTAAQIRKTDFYMGCVQRLTEERDELQDRLSAVLCPQDSHIWEPTTLFDGVSRCKRCGRVKE